jgi:hypothetical protein
MFIKSIKCVIRTYICLDFIYLKDKETKLIFNQIKFLLKVLSKSLLSDKSYQFMIKIENKNYKELVIYLFILRMIIIG